MTTTVKEVVELNIWDDNEGTVVQLHTLLVCSDYDAEGGAWVSLWAARF